MKMIDRFAGFTAAGTSLLLALGLAGCVGYRIGSMLPDKYQTVAVPTFVNASSEPLLENPTTSATISEIQIDGSLRIADTDRADTVLQVKLTGFDISPIAFSDNRARLANEYRMSISATLVLTDRATGEVIVEAPSIKGYSDFVVQGDLSSSKRTVLPKASEDLAHKIVERIVESW